MREGPESDLRPFLFPRTAGTRRLATQIRIREVRMTSRRLGKSAIAVSPICMGTMTFGSAADEAMSHRILDMSFEAGINFFDTAENYPVPPDEKWAGVTEEIVGRWMKTKRRDELIIATKVCGPSHGWLKGSQRAGMTISVDGASAAPLERVGAEPFLQLTNGATLLFVNPSQGRVLTGRDDPGQAARVLNAWYPQVVMKLGADGAMMYAGGRPDPFRVPAPAELLAHGRVLGAPDR